MYVVTIFIRILYSARCVDNSPSIFHHLMQLPGDKIVGLAKFFLGVGIPGDAKDFFNQIDALACLEDNRQGYFHAIYAIYLLRLVVHHLRIMNKMTAEMISVEKSRS